MRNALNLMAKVFGVVFGAGFALVAVGYLALGGFYVYERIESHASVSEYAPVQTKDTITAIELYDKNGFVPDILPDAQLDCEDKKGPWLKYSGKQPMCSVEIDGKIAAVISQQEAKDNLAGWMSVPNHKPDPLDGLGVPATEKSAADLPPCPSNDPLGIRGGRSCQPPAPKEVAPPCPASDPVGLRTKETCTPLPTR